MQFYLHYNFDLDFLAIVISFLVSLLVALLIVTRCIAQRCIAQKKGANKTNHRHSVVQTLNKCILSERLSETSRERVAILLPSRVRALLEKLVDTILVVLAGLEFHCFRNYFLVSKFKTLDWCEQSGLDASIRGILEGDFTFSL